LNRLPVARLQLLHQLDKHHHYNARDRATCTLTQFSKEALKEKRRKSDKSLSACRCASQQVCIVNSIVLTLRASCLRRGVMPLRAIGVMSHIRKLIKGWYHGTTAAYQIGHKPKCNYYEHPPKRRTSRTMKCTSASLVAPLVAGNHGWKSQDMNLQTKFLPICMHKRSEEPVEHTAVHHPSCIQRNNCIHQSMS
jgi:hypothetical protein